MNRSYAITIVVLIIILVIGAFILVSNRMNPTTSTNSGQTNLTTGTTGSTTTTTSTTTTSVGTTTKTTGTGSLSVKYDVVYNGTSFSPNTLTIKKGQTVIFTNVSSGAMQVASNPHPTHTDYPEFDQTKDTTQKDSSTYTFTFEKVGTWGYHNHANPSVKGTVVVNP